MTLRALIVRRVKNVFTHITGSEEKSFDKSTVLKSGNKIKYSSLRPVASASIATSQPSDYVYGRLTAECSSAAVGAVLKFVVCIWQVHGVFLT